MADISNPTSNITLYDESGNAVAVKTTGTQNELHVHDEEAVGYLETLATTPVATSNLWQDLSNNNKAFASTYEVTLSNNEQDVILVKNPTASGIDLRIKKVTFGVQSAATAITFRIYMQPTVTADGTGLNEINYNDRTVTASGEVYSQPTISARGNRFLQFDLNSTGTGVLDFDAELALHVNEGEYMLITAQPGSNNRIVSINVSWGEDDS